MCANFEPPPDKKKSKVKDKVLIYGAVPRESVWPTDDAPIVLPDFEIEMMRWGWPVPWDKKPLINAKSETVTELTTFKPHLQNRCLIPAVGFYEKRILFHQPGKPVFYMAGLWREDKGAKLFTMLTTTPNETVLPYHNRMPFILTMDTAVGWLGADWLQVLGTPDKTPLLKNKPQGELF